MLAILLVAANLLKERARRNLNRALFRCVIAPCPALFASSKPRWRWPRRLAWCCRRAEFRRRYLQRTSWSRLHPKKRRVGGRWQSSATGHSGSGEGKDNPAMQYVHDIGPIPGKEWEICGPPYDNRRARAL